MVNSQQVLEQWKSIRSKLSNHLLTPQEKECWNFMARSRANSFHISEVNLGRTDLTQLKETVEVEMRKELYEDGENDLLLDYWQCWNNFNGIILDWISLKQMHVFYNTKEGLEYLTQKLK